MKKYGLEHRQNEQTGKPYTSPAEPLSVIFQYFDPLISVLNSSNLYTGFSKSPKITIRRPLVYEEAQFTICTTNLPHLIIPFFPLLTALFCLSDLTASNMHLDVCSLLDSCSWRSISLQEDKSEMYLESEVKLEI